MQWNSKEIIILYVPGFATNCGRCISEYTRKRGARSQDPRAEAAGTLCSANVLCYVTYKT